MTVDENNYELRFLKPKTPLEYFYELKRGLFITDWNRAKYLFGSSFEQYCHSLNLSEENYKKIYINSRKRNNIKNRNRINSARYIVYYQQNYFVISYVYQDAKIVTIESSVCKLYGKNFFKNFNFEFIFLKEHGLVRMQWRKLAEEKKIFGKISIPLEDYPTNIRNFPNN